MSCKSYVDDLTIGQEESLLRRIVPGWLVLDKNTGEVRPSSQPFQNQRGHSAISVYLRQVLDENGLPPESVLEGHEGYSLASITAGLARKYNQGIMRNPEPHPAHAEVFGEKPNSVRRGFAKNAVWVIAPIL